jgi:quercetin dioxygenase-like cupin family protein
MIRLLTASLAALPLLTGAPARAAEAGATVTPIVQQKLPGAPGKTLSAVVVTYEPGAASPSHHHAGTVFAYVIEGTIRSALNDGEPRDYKAGETFTEPPGTHHAVSANASTTEPAKLLAIFVAEDGSQLTVFDK